MNKVIKKTSALLLLTFILTKVINSQDFKLLDKDIDETEKINPNNEFKRSYNKNLLIGAEYGYIFPSEAISPTKYQANIVEFNATYFPKKHWGYSAGVNFIFNDGITNFYSNVPLTGIFRLSISQRAISSFVDFIDERASILLKILIPHHYEFNLGTSFGYINPRNSDYESDRDAIDLSQDHISVTNRFTASLSAGLKISKEIGRLNIFFKQNILQTITNNFYINSSETRTFPIEQRLFFTSSFGISYDLNHQD